MRYKPEHYDAIIRGLVEKDGRWNMLIPYFLMGAYAYEELDDPLFSDAGWDWICSTLAEKWDVVEHVHKPLIDREALSSGTASYLAGKLPTIVQMATKALMLECKPASRPVQEIQMLPVTDMSDLLGTIKKVESDMADLLGISEVVQQGNPIPQAITDLL